ncbi:hypothetical protein D3C72_1813970 [compost metagenome]
MLIRGHGGFQGFAALTVAAVKQTEAQRPRQERDRHIGTTRQFGLNGESALSRHRLDQRGGIRIGGNIWGSPGHHIIPTRLKGFLFLLTFLVRHFVNTRLNLKVVAIP